MSKAKYAVYFYQSGRYGVSPILCQTKKEANQHAKEYLEALSLRSYQNAGYKKMGSIKAGMVKFEHPVFGVDARVWIDPTN